jgi:hypothetical protein
MRRCNGLPAALVAAAAAVILLNLALLGYAQPRNDPVGKLNPQAVLVDTPSPIPEPLPPSKETDENGD